MRAFASSGYLLRDMRLEVRLVYTGFLLLACIGMLTMAGFQLYQIGPTPGGIVAYYCGGEVGGEMTFAKTFRQLVEVTHFHAFIMGVVYLVLAHLFLATPVRSGWKRFFIILAFGGLAGDIVSPWLIRYLGGAFAYLLLLSWLAEWIGFAAFITVPIGKCGSRMDLPNSRQSDAEVRCDCGSLMARVTADGIELKCRRCKRVVLLAADDVRRGWVAVPLHVNEVLRC